jgi:Conserved hypothetical protein 2217 (DUF2460)
MSNRVFPVFPGIDWNVKKTPTFGVMVQPSANGRTVRVPRFADPMWQFECSFEFLRDDTQNDELNQLMGFFCANQGGLNSFLINLTTLTQNKADSSVTGQMLATDANGFTPLARSMGPYNEVIYELQDVPLVRRSDAVLEPGVDWVLCNASPVVSRVGAYNDVVHDDQGNPISSDILGCDACVQIGAVNGSACPIWCYGRVGGVPVFGAPINYYRVDGSVFSNVYMGYGSVSLSSDYWFMYNPATNGNGLISDYATAAAAVQAGQVCCGHVHTPDANGNGGSGFGGGFGLATSGYSGYYIHAGPLQVLSADFGWYYRVIFSATNGSSSDPQLGNYSQEFAALWQGIYEAQQITLVTVRE